MEKEQHVRFETIKSYCKRRSFPTESSIRWWIFYNRLGFADKCIKRCGKKILIDVPAVDCWICECDEKSKVEIRE